MKYKIAIVWFFMWAVTWPAVFADQLGYSCRHDLAFSIGWSLFPPAWILAPFVTGFYEHGFKWSCP